VELNLFVRILLFYSYQVGSGSQNGRMLSISDALSFEDYREMNTKLQKVSQLQLNLLRPFNKRWYQVLSPT